MLDADEQRRSIEAELERTAFQRKVVTSLTMQETFDDAVAFFTEQGYRSGRTGRPNQIFVMGGREGNLPRVTAELLVQTNVGKSKVTMVSISGAGARLSTVLGEYAVHLREIGRKNRPERQSEGAG